MNVLSSSLNYSIPSFADNDILSSTASSFVDLLNTTFQKRSLWSDEVLALWVPVAAYWIYSTLWYIIMKVQLPYFEQYRIHTLGDMEKRNKVTFSKVLSMVTLQQIIQVILGLLVLKPTDPLKASIQYQQNILYWKHTISFFTSRLPVSGISTTATTTTLNILIAQGIEWILKPTLQFFVAMCIMDAHQYFLHRLFHINKFLYKHIHSHHHRLYVPYAFGALYNHPIEGFLLDSLGATVAMELSGMSARMSLIFFTFSTLKTVDDHCGYAIPWDPLQFFFGNNVQYHDIHHQSFGIKRNFSQPFFTFWDKFLNTEMSLKEAYTTKATYSKNRRLETNEKPN